MPYSHCVRRLELSLGSKCGLAGMGDSKLALLLPAGANLSTGPDAAPASGRHFHRPMDLYIRPRIGYLCGTRKAQNNKHLWYSRRIGEPAVQVRRPMGV